MKIVITVLVGVLTMLGLSADAADNDKLQVAVITGGHGFKADPFLEVFRAQDDIDFEYIALDKKDGFIDEADAEKYDVIVLYNMSARISDDHKKSLLGFIERGGGLIAMHHAIANYPNWAEWSEIIGAKYFLKPQKWKGEDCPKSEYTHDVQMSVTIEDKNHPITQGVEDFVIHDETYRKWMLYPDNHLLLSCDHPESDDAVGWVRTYGDNEVCYLQLGHGPEAYANPNFQTLVAQAIQWAGSRT
jgi:type 1 glutamine amidotransferase